MTAKRNGIGTPKKDDHQMDALRYAMWGMMNRPKLTRWQRFVRWLKKRRVGTSVRVTNPKTGKSVTLRKIDSGPPDLRHACRFVNLKEDYEREQGKR